MQAALGLAGSAVLVLGLGGDLLSGNPSLRIGSAQAILSLAALPLLWAADRVGHTGDRPGTRVRLLTAWRSLLTVLWCALLFGVAEVVLLAIRRGLLQRLTWTGPDYAWTTPASWLAILSPLAIGFAAAGFTLPRLARPWVALFAVGAIGLAIFALFFPIHIVAAIVVGLGLAWRSASIARRHPAGFRALSRRTAPVLVAVPLALGALDALPARPDSTGARRSPADASAPNVLLIILDTVRAANLDLYGYGRATAPSLRALAAEGMTFGHAISSAPWTLPSHASMFTGLYPPRLSSDWRVPLDGSERTLAEVFREAGYSTGGFVSNILYTNAETGLARGFDHYDGFRATWRQLFLDSSLGQRISSPGGRHKREVHQKPGPLVSRAFLEWLDDGADRPFFAFLNYFDAHQPYRSTPALAARFGGAHTLVDRYDASIAHVDEQLGSLFEELKRRGELDRTIVVVTSDHGEHMYDHGLTGHGNSMYMSLLHVPLVLRYPARVPVGRFGDAVTLRDLPATILDLAGLPAEIGDSRSLAWSWAEGGQRERPSAPLFAAASQGINAPPNEPISRGDMESLVRGGFHYIHNEGDGSEELYRFETDPWETRDLAGDDAWSRELDAFRRELTEMTGARPGDLAAAGELSVDRRPR